MWEKEYCVKCGKKIGYLKPYSPFKKQFCKDCLKNIIDKINKKKGKDKCAECGKIQGSINFKVDEKYYCANCYNKIKEKKQYDKIQEMRSQDYTPAPGEIKCPYCNGWFKPVRKTPTSTAGNITRGAVFLPWGVVKAVKNKPYVECPHCHMRIPQG